MNKFFHKSILFFACITMLSCNNQNRSSEADSQTLFTGESGEVKLVVLDPGHFHASLLQKFPQPRVNDTVYVYAPEGEELEQYLASIEAYNTRSENPTSWVEIVYTGDDYLDKMIDDRKGNVVILAGNNKKKTEYIYAAINAGYNVLSDKPMAITRENFYLLSDAFERAKENDVYLYDVMTERYEIVNSLTRELVNNSELFGELQKGTTDDPAIVMQNLHHFYKEVSGVPLVRPAWFYDVEQQGEGMTDVGVHLVDLVQWQSFSDEVIDYRNDIVLNSVTHWPTRLTLEQFTRSTKLSAYPDFLQKYVKDSVLEVFANGTINYQLKGVNVSITALWNYEAAKGSGDAYNGYIKGTNATIEIVQDSSVDFIKQLFISKDSSIDEQTFDANISNAVNDLQQTYPFLTVEKVSDGRYQFIAPVEFRKGHEDFFGMVAEKYFEFLVNRDMPDWEISNMIAKFSLTTSALESVKNQDSE